MRQSHNSSASVVALIVCSPQGHRKALRLTHQRNALLVLTPQRIVKKGHDIQHNDFKQRRQPFLEPSRMWAVQVYYFHTGDLDKDT